VSDRGPQFVSKFWSELHKSLGTKLLHSSTYHPQISGQTERVNQILEDMLRVLGVCFVAEDPKKNTFERSSQKQTPKLLSTKLRHKDKSQDEGSNRLKDELT
jgi:transposase InsO family protein